MQLFNILIDWGWEHVVTASDLTSGHSISQNQTSIQGAVLYVNNTINLHVSLLQSMSSLFSQTLKESRNLTILIGHWFLHAYGIIAITQLQDPVLHWALLAVVPFPSLFYILTSKFTDPSKLHAE